MTESPARFPTTLRGSDLGAGGRILVAEDDTALRELLHELLAESGHEVTVVPNGAAALEQMDAADSFDLVLTDLVMPGVGGEGVLAAVTERAPQVPVIVMTAFGTIDSAVRLVRAGAFDYVTKPVATADLLQAVARGVREGAARRASSQRDDDAALAPLDGNATAPDPEHALDGIVAESVTMRNLLALATRIAPSPHPVLLTGESGTGKETIARAIHALSRGGPFVVVNCGAIPPGTIEAELFGHERGAFPGADLRMGLIERAHGGTLFLDETGELPLGVQPALLRFLESGEIRRTGATRSRHVDVRVIASTHRDLESEMREGRFREDLYWRLNVLPLEVTPQRERPADVLPLARHFLAEIGCTRELDASTAALLTSYTWPGNARELRNAMHRAAAFGTSDTIMPDDLPPRLREANRVAALVAQASQQQLPLREVERAYVLEIVRRTDGNKSRAADILGLDRKTLYRKLAEYAQEPESPGDIMDNSAGNSAGGRARSGSGAGESTPAREDAS